MEIALVSKDINQMQIPYLLVNKYAETVVIYILNVMMVIPLMGMDAPRHVKYSLNMNVQ